MPVKGLQNDTAPLCVHVLKKIILRFLLLNYSKKSQGLTRP